MTPVLQLWRCPKCGSQVETLGVVEGHKCKAHNNRWVSWVLVPKEDEE